MIGLRCNALRLLHPTRAGLRFVGVPKCFQYSIHACLIAGALLPEPCQYVFIHTQRDLRFARWQRQTAIRYCVRPIRW